jgi:hypothetical protein
MPITYQYEPDTKIIRAKATGTITTKEMLDYVTNITEDITIEKGFIEVVDFQTVSDLVVTYSELAPFPDTWERYMEKGCKATVIFAPTDLCYGTFRMLQTVLSLRAESSKDKFAVARSKNELEKKLAQLQA